MPDPPILRLINLQDRSLTELTDDQYDLLFPEHPSIHDHEDQYDIMGYATLDDNRDSLVIFRIDGEYTKIGFFIGRSSGRGKPLFALCDPEYRRQPEIPIRIRSGIKKEFDDMIEVITPEVLRDLPDAYFEDDVTEMVNIVRTIERWWIRWRAHQKQRAATVIQRAVREWFARPYYHDGTEGLHYRQAMDRFKSLVIAVGI